MTTAVAPSMRMTRTSAPVSNGSLVRRCGPTRPHWPSWTRPARESTGSMTTASRPTRFWCPVWSVGRRAAAATSGGRTRNSSADRDDGEHGEGQPHRPAQHRRPRRPPSAPDGEHQQDEVEAHQLDDGQHDGDAQPGRPRRARPIQSIMRPPSSCAPSVRPDVRMLPDARAYRPSSTVELEPHAERRDRGSRR